MLLSDRSQKEYKELSINMLTYMKETLIKMERCMDFALVLVVNIMKLILAGIKMILSMAIG